MAASIQRCTVQAGEKAEIIADTQLLLPCVSFILWLLSLRTATASYRATSKAAHEPPLSLSICPHSLTHSVTPQLNCSHFSSAVWSLLPLSLLLWKPQARQGACKERRRQQCRWWTREARPPSCPRTSVGSASAGRPAGQLRTYSSLLLLSGLFCCRYSFTSHHAWCGLWRDL